MKHIYRLLLVLFFTKKSVLWGQVSYLWLAGGPVPMPPGAKNLGESTGRFHVCWMQVSKPLNAAEHHQLSQAGIRLLEYFPTQCYRVAIPKMAALTGLAFVRSVDTIRISQKVDPRLTDENPAGHIVMPDGRWRVLVKQAFPLEKERFCLRLAANGFEFDSTWHYHQMVTVLLHPAELPLLAKMPEVTNIEPVLPAPQPDNRPGKTDHRTNVANNGFGRNLLGQGMTFGVGDGGFVAAHKDFESRLFNQMLTVIGGFGNHGDHVTGTVGGGGKLQSSNEGMAPRATLFTNQATNILNDIVTLHTQAGMIGTTNSYSYGWPGCFSGKYTVNSNAIDAQLVSMPFISHQFAAGNDGTRTCSPYPSGYGNMHSDFAAAKNTITVGNLDATDALSSSSSRGPAFDGRIKPDLCGVGSSVVSTVPTNTYSTKSGTSMATPGVSGSIILLYQRYKQLHNDSLPEGEYIKTLLMNTADDLGTAGPDFQYGYGRINMRKALLAMEAGNSFKGEVNQGDSVSLNIQVPAGTSLLKIMLGWRDAEGNPSAAKALVSDLDLKVTDPSNTLFLPWKLDTAKASVASAATRNTDRLNNHEQVTINNPASGTYTIKVLGYDLPAGFQNFHVVYETTPQEVVLTYPIGGEKLIPGNSERIRWDATGFSSGTWSLDYSTNGGSSWTTITSSVAITSRQFSWTVPSVASDQMRVRVYTTGSFADTSENNFTILATPTGLSQSVCDRSVKLFWNQVSGASYYEVLMIDSLGQWDTLAATTNTFLWVPMLKNSTQYWFAVQAVTSGGATSDHSAAIAATPTATTCNLGNDAGIADLIRPKTGRKFTTLALTGSDTIEVYLKNYGNTSVSNFDIKYSVNGGSPFAQTYTGTLSAGTGTAVVLAANVPDFSAAGDYLLKIWTELSGDSNPNNDTLIFKLRHIANPALTLPYSPYLNMIFEPVTIRTATTGLTEAGEWDYDQSSSSGQCRINVPGSFSAGGRGFTLDKATNGGGTVKNTLTATLNLSNYAGSPPPVKLQFDYTNHGEENHSGDSVWLRGCDTCPWIKVMSLATGLPAVGFVKEVRNIRVDSLLAASSQSFSPSFQLKIGQEDDSTARYFKAADGITVSNLMLYDASNDVEMLGITGPSAGCGLGNEQVQVQVRNSTAATMTNVLLGYRLNGGSWVTEMVNISANTTLTHTFGTTANLGSPGLYAFDAFAYLSGDPNHTNDTARNFQVRNSLFVSSFPYYESFETGHGHWYSSGTNSTWAWGVPHKPYMDTAANGIKCWATSLGSNYNIYETSFLNSPCFDLSGFSSNPIISFNLMHDLEDDYDFAWLEYSENGNTWTKLGQTGQGTGWYNYSGNVWNGTDTPWRVSSYVIPVSSMTQKDKVRFRLVVVSDNYVNQEGIAVDDIHIFGGNTGIHPGNVSVQATCNNSGWVDFDNGNQRIASINDNGNNLGTVTVQTYKHVGAVRQYNGQKYLNRNWVITPTNQPASPVTVRLFLLRSELDSLLNVDANSSKFQHLGLSKYSGSNEDSSMSNDDHYTSPATFITPSSITFKPFNNGYIAEFSVSGFSEFFMNSGGGNHVDPLPLKLLAFDAVRAGNDINLHWTTASETGVEYFGIEKYTSPEGLLPSGWWMQIGRVDAADNSTTSRYYQFTDPKVLPNEVACLLQYRLRICDAGGVVDYSPIRVVSHSPSNSHFHLQPAPGGYMLMPNLDGYGRAMLFAADGRQLLVLPFNKSGTLLPTHPLPAGAYLLQVIGENWTETRRVVIVK